MSTVDTPVPPGTANMIHEHIRYLIVTDKPESLARLSDMLTRAAHAASAAQQAVLNDRVGNTEIADRCRDVVRRHFAAMLDSER